MVTQDNFVSSDNGSIIKGRKIDSPRLVVVNEQKEQEEDDLFVPKIRKDSDNAKLNNFGANNTSKFNAAKTEKRDNNATRR